MLEGRATLDRGSNTKGYRAAKRCWESERLRWEGRDEERENEGMGV